MNITFKKLLPQDYPLFRSQLKKAFSLAVIQEFGPSDKEVISDEEINDSLNRKNAQAFFILLDGAQAGGIVLNIDEAANFGEVELFYILPERHSNGIGQAAWQAVEKKYPQIYKWELVTPYFEKRNINFYVNKCGFHIVEFFCAQHPDPHMPSESDDFKRELFRFEKIIPQH